jgi:hypothetical protein
VARDLMWTIYGEMDAQINNTRFPLVWLLICYGGSLTS